MPSEPTRLIAPIETLPNELLYRISSFIPANSVTTRLSVPDRFLLALTSKYINLACTPLLYEYVFLDSPLQLYRFHRSAGVARESWRTVSIVFGYRALFKMRSKNVPAGTRWEDMLEPLRGMRSLRELVIDSNEETGSYIRAEAEHPVLNYLSTHALEPEFLPRLSMLEVPYYPELLNLCRGRPMTSVILGSNPSPRSSESFDAFIPELGNIQGALEELALYIPLQVDPRIRQVVGLCPKVKVASLRFGDLLLASSNFKVAFPLWMERTFSPWSRLTHLTIRTPQLLVATLDEQSYALQSLRKIFPKLTHITLPALGGEWTRDLYFSTKSGDEIPEWTPRPDLGTKSLDWWLDILKLQVPIKPLRDGGGDEDAGYVGTLDVTATTARDRIRTRWQEAFVPALRDIKTRLAERAKPVGR